MWPPGAGLESTVYLRQSRAKAGTPPGVQGRNITSGPCRPSLATGTWLSSSCDVSCLPPRFQVEITSFGWKTETVRNLGVCCLSRSEITATSVSGSSDIPFLPVGNLGPRPVLGSIPGLYCIFCLPVFDTFLIPRPTFYALSISATRNYFWSMDRAGLGPRISTSISWPLLGPRSWAMQGITLPLHARKCPHTTSPKQLQKLVLVLKT